MQKLILKIYKLKNYQKNPVDLKDLNQLVLENF